MYCPRCGAEYRPGFTHCPDCDADLVAEAPVESVAATREEPEALPFDPHQVPSLVMVYRSQRHDAEAMRAMLEGSGIPAILGGEGYSSAYPLTVGVLGEGRVLVREEDRAAALALIEEAKAGDFELEDPEPPEAQATDLRYYLGLAAVAIALLILLASRGGI